MAYDKVVDSQWLDNGIQKIADAVKEKAGVTDPLSFPDEIEAAAKSIQVGGDIDNTVVDGIIDRTIAGIKNDTVTTVAAHAFRGCSQLVEADFATVTEIKGNAFNGCSKLVRLILRSSSVCVLEATSAFTSTQIKSGGSGRIYVPKEIVENYKQATNWVSLGDDSFDTIENLEGGNI